MTAAISCFERFLEGTVNLTPGRLEKLGSTSRAVESALRASSESELTVIEARPQGSFAQGTIINPKDEKNGFDADLLVQCDDIEDPVDLLRTIQRTLNGNRYYAGKLSRKSRCVTINYAGDFSLDVVPAVERQGRLWIVNREATWDPLEETDPDGFNEWLQATDKHTGGHLIPTIRLVKFIRSRKGRPALKSVVLTFLLADAARRRPSTEFTDLPTTLTLLLRDVSTWWATHPAPTIHEPTCSAELRLDGTDYDVVRKQLDSMAVRAENALVAPTDASMVSGWRKLFGTKFPAPQQRVALAALALDPGEQDLWRDFGISTDGAAHCRIDGTYSEGTSAGKVLFPIGRSLPRQRALRFEVLGHDVAEPFDVYWKVKNRGAAAAEAGGLRGEITRGNSVNYETTRWPGDHYVEAYVVKDGICLAMARQDVPIR